VSAAKAVGGNDVCDAHQHDQSLELAGVSGTSRAKEGEFEAVRSRNYLSRDYIFRTKENETNK
jgi:hypothetical protein